MTDKPKVTLSSILDWLTDKLAVFIALGVGVATTATMFASFPHNAWFSLVMAVLGGTLVLFQARALVKRMMGLWRLLAVIIIFCDVSWFLTMADSKQPKTVTTELATDIEVTRLDNAVDNAKTHRDELTRQLSEAQNRVTIDSIAKLLDDAQRQVKEAQDKRDAYRPPETTVESNKLFLAIPSAIMDPTQWIAFVAGLLIAVSLQWTILAVLRGAVKRAKSEERAQAPKRRRRRKSATATAPEAPTEETMTDSGNL